MTTDLAKIKQRLDAEVAQVRGSADLTNEAKRRMIAEAYQKAQAEYSAAVEAQERAIRERADKAERALFETPYPYGTSDVEEAQIRALRRSAYNDVYYSTISFPFTAEDPGHAREELDRLLGRAELTGDKELADAVYAVATERGERSVADAYLEKRPQAKKRWEEYVAARTEADSLDDPLRMLSQGAGALAAPAELDGFPGQSPAATRGEGVTVDG